MSVSYPGHANQIPSDADWFGPIPVIRTQIRQEVVEMELQEMKLTEMHYDDESVHYM